VTLPDELLQLASGLRRYGQMLDRSEVQEPLTKVEKAFQQVNRAFSGSWLGYHSRVFWTDFLPKPASVTFSLEWGLMNRLSNPRYYDDHDQTWQQYDDETVRMILAVENCPREQFQLCPLEQSNFAPLPRNTSLRMPIDISWHRA